LPRRGKDKKTTEEGKRIFLPGKTRVKGEKAVKDQ